MALTIGRRWPTSAPRGDYAETCQICQVKYRRSQLMRRTDGVLVCFGPGTLNDADGRDAATLDQLNAGHARSAGTRTRRRWT